MQSTQITLQNTTSQSWLLAGPPHRAWVSDGSRTGKVCAVTLECWSVFSPRFGRVFESFRWRVMQHETTIATAPRRHLRALAVESLVSAWVIIAGGWGGGGCFAFFALHPFGIAIAGQKPLTVGKRASMRLCGSCQQPELSSIISGTRIHSPDHYSQIPTVVDIAIDEGQHPD